MDELSQEQSAAANEAINTSATVTGLTGPAGTGKSFISRYLQDYHDFHGCATTGKAAAIINGCTVDSLFALSRGNWTYFSRSYLEKNMLRTPQNIIIEEASALGYQMARLVYDAAITYNKKLLLVGDWAQSKPVKDDWPFLHPMFQNMRMIKLTECHRQSAGEYLTNLNKLRVGKVDHGVRLFFRERIQPVPPEEEGWLLMYGTNALTDNYNFNNLSRHIARTKAVPFQIQATFTDLRSGSFQQDKPRDANFIEKAIEDTRFAHNEAFALGCDVVLTMNSAEAGYVNGDVGKIVDGMYMNGKKFSEVDKQPCEVSNVVVHIPRQDRDVTVGREKKETNDATGTWPQHQVIGIPLRLGPAVTVHKSQGMTVDKAWFDMSSLMCFPEGSRHGLAYVALSRTRTADNLRVSSWYDEAIECDDIVKPYL